MYTESLYIFCGNKNLFLSWKKKKKNKNILTFKNT